jgi:hypothetical protein
MSHLDFERSTRDTDRRTGVPVQRPVPCQIPTSKAPGSYVMQLGSEEVMDGIEERLEELIEEVRKLIEASKH